MRTNESQNKTIFETSAALSAIPGFETLSGWTSAQDFAVIIEARIKGGRLVKAQRIDPRNVCASQQRLLIDILE
jgi:hypothetical protein